MATYRVILKTGAYAYITVEADSKEEAADLAFEHVPYICAQCSGWGREDSSLELGEVWDVDDEDAIELVDE